MKFPTLLTLIFSTTLLFSGSPVLAHSEQFHQKAGEKETEPTSENTTTEEKKEMQMPEEEALTPPATKEKKVSDTHTSVQQSPQKTANFLVQPGEGVLLLLLFSPLLLYTMKNRLYRRS